MVDGEVVVEPRSGRAICRDRTEGLGNLIRGHPGQDTQVGQFGPIDRIQEALTRWGTVIAVSLLGIQEDLGDHLDPLEPLGVRP